MTTENDKTGNNRFRWCEKREQHVALAVCRAMAKKRKQCCKCLARYDQLPLFPESMFSGKK